MLISIIITTLKGVIFFPAASSFTAFLAASIGIFISSSVRPQHLYTTLASSPIWLNAMMLYIRGLDSVLIFLLRKLLMYLNKSFLFFSIDIFASIFLNSAFLSIFVFLSLSTASAAYSRPSNTSSIAAL